MLQRLNFIDILRGLACIWMIETHVVNAFLPDGYKDNLIFNLIDISNGFVAVCFIFCAGAGFRLALESKFKEYITMSAPLLSYVKRLLFILAIAYWIQTPEFSLQKTLQSSSEEFSKFFMCNVLQLIVASSLLSLALLISTRSFFRFRIASYLVLIIFFWCTPFIWSIPQDQLGWIPLFLRMYIVTQPTSLFPLFPWAGYYFAGIIVTDLFLISQDKDSIIKKMIIASLGITAFAFISKEYLWQYYPSTLNWWYVSPVHALFRTAGVMILFSLFYMFKDYCTGKKSAFMQLLGKESLVVYVGQGMLIYGSVASKGLQYFLPIIVSPLEVLLLTSGITASMGAYANMWNHFKRHSPEQAQWVLYAFCTLFVIAFIIIPD